MEQTILDGICIVSFYIAGTVGLLVAGEVIYRIYELAAPAVNRKVSGLFSNAFARRRQRPPLNCSCHVLPARFRV
jgi:hypothetical protein